MRILVEVFTNRAILAAGAAWAAAQLLKVFLTLVVSRRLDISRMVGSGGMPSSHSAMVCALVTAIGYREGFTSSLFALAFGFACVVMYDAAGVRRSTGKNAAVINHLLDGLVGNGFTFNEERLQELVGHTPIQVCAGALLGILVGTLIG
ncbi:MAG: divergent PAP2 family protein [Clostridia bacterium]|nr:divergent PAP2 family protein [Clostridia bacterium]